MAVNTYGPLGNKLNICKLGFSSNAGTFARNRGNCLSSIMRMPCPLHIKKISQIIFNDLLRNLTATKWI